MKIKCKLPNRHCIDREILHRIGRSLPFPRDLARLLTRESCSLDDVIDLVDAIEAIREQSLFHYIVLFFKVKGQTLAEISALLKCSVSTCARALHDLGSILPSELFRVPRARFNLPEEATSGLSSVIGEGCLRKKAAPTY